MKFLIDIPELFITSAGIYKISNNKDKRVYIGRTKNLKNRAEEHKYAYKHRKCNYKVRDFIENHPDAVFTFSVILFTNDIKKEEESAIKKYNSVDNGFNILHNDNEFTTKKWSITKNNKRKNIVIKKLTEKEKLLLQRGYIRKKDKLIYSPSLSKAILEESIQVIPKENKKKKIHRREKNWKPADLSFLCADKKRVADVSKTIEC